MGDDRPPPRRRLKSKIMIMAILPLLAAQGMMVALVYFMGTEAVQDARSDLTRTWTDKSLDIAKGFAYTVEQSSSLDNRSRIQALVDGFVESRGDLKLLNVYLPDGASPSGYSIGASSNRSLVGTAADGDHVGVITSGNATYFIEPATEQGRPTQIMEVIVPIHDPGGRSVASTGLTWSLAAVDTFVGSLQRTFLTNLLIGALSLLGFSVMTFVMVFNAVSDRITKPLASLREAAEAISTGNFEAPISASSNDEIGDLAESFQRMTASLKLAAKLKLPTQPPSFPP